MLNVVKQLNEVIWGVPMLILLLGTHLFFTFRLKFVQKKIGKAVLYSVREEDDAHGDLTSFASLATILAATLGTGNIIGVSTAVALGGPGAIFWCWITGVFGMATSYAECYLGISYRKKVTDGSYVGGPMYVLEDGLHLKGLAIFYALCTVAASFGVGCTTQSNSITSVTSTWGFSPYIVGFVIATITGLVIIGGVKSIGNVCTKLVPAMGIFYILSCLVILFLNYNYIMDAVILILKSAFSVRALSGGLIGSSLYLAARYGIARGLFTNEAGLGTAAIAAAAAKSKDPTKQALVSMSATFWDTVVMCGITGLVIVTNLIKFPESIKGANSARLTTIAFRQLPFFGETVLNISIILFAIATLLGWSYYGERAIKYLTLKRVLKHSSNVSKTTLGNNDATESAIKLYQIGYIVMIFVGAIMSLDLVWELSDLINAAMAIPGLLGVLLLYKKIKIPS